MTPNENKSISRKKISKRLSYYLRHHPEKIGMELDDEGFSSISIEELARRMGISTELIIQVVENDEKQRFTIKNGKIRANFGHSHVVGRKIWESTPPTPKSELPPLLYHGTRQKYWNKIKHEGLKSQARQFVHLSTSIDWAILVGKRMVQNPLVLEINVEKAMERGVKFWMASRSTVLATHVPPECIRLLHDGNTKKKQKKSK